MNRSADEKKAAKAAYDRDYRARDGGNRKAKKAAYHKRTYDPTKARVKRAKNRDKMRAIQAAWYARPENREAKRQYDINLRASEYGDHAEAWLLLLELGREIRRLVPDRYERAKGRRGHYWLNRKQRGDLRT